MANRTMLMRKTKTWNKNEFSDAYKRVGLVKTCYLAGKTL